MHSISHLPEDEQIHYVKCTVCGLYMDCRDLSDVAKHEHRTRPVTSIAAGVWGKA